MFVGLGDREEVVDRLAVIEQPDLDCRPVLMFPAGVIRRRCDHAQAVAARHKSAKVLDVLNVVEDNEPVGGIRGPQIVEAAADDLVLSGLVARVDLQFLGEFDKTALDGLE